MLSIESLLGMEQAEKPSEISSVNGSPQSQQKSKRWSVTEKLQKLAIGLGAVRDLGTLEIDQQTIEQKRQHDRWNRAMLDKRLGERFGVTVPEEPKGGEDMATVRVDSPDNHYHYPPRGGLLGDLAKLALAAALGAGGLAAWWMLNNNGGRTKPPPVSTKPVLDPGGLKIDVERPK